MSEGAKGAPAGGPVAVIGLGTFGGTVATDLVAFGHHVIGIDTDERRVNELADTLTQAMIADARDEKALRDAGVDKCDVVIIAMGENLEANIVGAMNVRLLGVRDVWVKSRSRTHRRILREIGFDKMVNPERDMGHRVAQRIHNPFVTDYMVAAENVTVVSLNAPRRLVGKRLQSIGFAKRFGVECLGILRAGKLQRFNEDPEIIKDDALLLLGPRAQLQHFGETQCG
ncbi:TrkA family potassium uptake protein [Acuticoccus sp. MNP-M23]|uniref:potassium channel family protein n=1 Tax=Acuticoccus sp. MNP-M23 TaxID=3072793 RepID=UPI0028150863|nr:TrkA family potassium uptake protein [Acuticoccus sp. MNP-M23]WMS44242.1 TrkA family potassium uptake protein [Acuticoccus sp. MNP-M23]